jgi:hypothetical protein
MIDAEQQAESRTSAQTYEDALAFLSTAPVVCDESIELIAHLWRRSLAVVRSDLAALRNKEA